MAQRVQNDVDAERIAVGSEFEKVPRIFSFTLPRVINIGIVGHEYHQPATLIADAAAMGVDAVRPVLRCAAAGAPHPDRGNLWNTFNWVLRVKERMIRREIEDRVFLRRPDA